MGFPAIATVRLLKRRAVSFGPDTPGASGEGDGLTAADRLKYTEAFNIFDKHQQLGRRCWVLVDFLWGDRFPKKLGCLKMFEKTTCGKKAAGGRLVCFCLADFLRRLWFWNRFVSPRSYSSR